MADIPADASLGQIQDEILVCERQLQILTCSEEDVRTRDEIMTILTNLRERARSLRRPKQPSNTVENLGLCSKCWIEAKILCNECKNMPYCSPDCQTLDSEAHKILCESFTNYSTHDRPTSGHRRCVLFETDGHIRFVWAKLEYMELSEVINPNNLLRSIPHGARMLHFARHPKLNRLLDHVVGIFITEDSLKPECRMDLNLSIERVTTSSRSKDQLYRGPVLAAAMQDRIMEPSRWGDITLKDFSCTIDFLDLYPGVKPYAADLKFPDMKLLRRGVVVSKTLDAPSAYEDLKEVCAATRVVSLKGRGKGNETEIHEFDFVNLGPDMEFRCNLSLLSRLEIPLHVTKDCQNRLENLNNNNAIVSSFKRNVTQGSETFGSAEGATCGDFLVFRIDGINLTEYYIAVVSGFTKHHLTDVFNRYAEKCYDTVTPFSEEDTLAEITAAKFDKYCDVWKSKARKGEAMFDAKIGINSHGHCLCGSDVHSWDVFVSTQILVSASDSPSSPVQIDTSEHETDRARKIDQDNKPETGRPDSDTSTPLVERASPTIAPVEASDCSVTPGDNVDLEKDPELHISDMHRTADHDEDLRRGITSVQAFDQAEPSARLAGPDNAYSEDARDDDPCATTNKNSSPASISTDGTGKEELPFDSVECRNTSKHDILPAISPRRLAIKPNWAEKVSNDRPCCPQDDLTPFI